MKKHAYLIMAHTECDLLKKLIGVLDDDRADIYLHVDKKSHDIQTDELASIVSRSALFLIPSSNVSWGGWSQIACELNLLQTAITKQYQYYHLISGVDFPLKTQDEINNFFDSHFGLEFIKFDSMETVSEPVLERIRYYHFFQDSTGRGSGPVVALFDRMENISLKLQKWLKVDRTHKIPFSLYKGANWFSITNDLALYVVSHRDEIRKYFRWTLCADEIFLQSLVMNSRFKENIAYDNLREIDWKRGLPYTYTDEDYAMLCDSSAIFCRKVSFEKSPKLILQLTDKLNQQIAK